MRYLLTALLLFITQPLWAAAAYDAQSTQTGGGVSSIDWPHTNTGANRYIAICTGNRDVEAVSSVTYNAVGLTVKDTENAAGVSNECWESLGFEPASGANDAVINFGGVPGNIVAFAMSFTGVDQVAPSGTATGAQGGGASLSTDITVPTDGIGFDSLVLGSGTIPDTITVGAGQTQRATQDALEAQIRGSTSPDAGTNAMGWSWAASDHYDTLIAFPINPAAVATARPRVIIVE